MPRAARKGKAAAKGGAIAPRPVPSAPRDGDQVTIEGETYTYDANAADNACRFFEDHLVFSKAEWHGRPFVLQEWQKNEVIRPLFGWKCEDGTRRYQTLYLEVPRKNGKTELAAGIGLALLIADGEHGAEVYCLAVTGDQARLVFKAAGGMVSGSPTLGGRIDTLATALYDASSESALKPLTGKPTGKHGFNPSGSISDELHEWKTGELFQVIRDGQGARRQPLNVMITSAGEYGVGFGWEMHEYARQVIAGEIEAGTFLAVIYGAEDGDDWTNEATWSKANPNYGVSVRPKFLRDQFKMATALPRLENNFKRYHLGIWTEQAVRWFPIETWDQAAGASIGWEAFEDALAGRPCYGGLDLSSTTDMTALSWIFGDPIGGKDKVYVLTRLWLPDGRVDAKIKRMKVDVRRWIADGAVIATAGDVVDYREIRHQIDADAERFQIQGLGIDRWNATQLAVELREDGLPVVLFGQGFASMSAPAKDLERLVLGGRLDHGGQPALRWMAKNVAVETDSAGNIKPSRNHSVGNIDGMVATIVGLGLAAKREDGQVNYELGSMFAE